MKNDNGSEKTTQIFAVALMVLAIIAFIWIWFFRQKPSSDQYASLENLEPVSVAGLESKAKTLFEGLKNNSGIPISEPTGKMGRQDPFASL